MTLFQYFVVLYKKASLHPEVRKALYFYVLYLNYIQPITSGYVRAVE